MTLNGQRAFDDLGTPLSDVPFCVLDLETTGVAPDSCEITEIGAIRYQGGVETGRFHTLVNPHAPIPPTVTVLTGITQAMVIEAPRIEEALPSFLEFISDAVIVGHNVRFDISFINAAALRLGYPRLANRSADTLRLARRLLGGEVRSLKLASLAAYLGSPIAPNHRAFDDALATAHVFWALLERAGSIGVTHLDDLLALPTIKGSRAIGKLSLTERLPRTPGVYLFRDRFDRPVYIGKATNLRSRVRSYFGGDERQRVDAMLRDLERIDHIRTSSEIEAAVLELRLIAEHVPRHNRRSKPPQSLHWVRVTNERFPRLSLARTVGDGLAHVGPFRSRRSAEQVMHAIWDSTRIRRCSKPGRGCHYSQLGVAVCPCDGSVSERTYRAIVDSLIEGLDDPGILVQTITERLTALAAHERYEDAANCRDGWEALTHALRRQREWQTLQGAGRVVARNGKAMIAIEMGRLVAAWSDGGPQPLLPIGTAVGKRTHPESMLEADEASLLWRWLVHPETELLEVTGTFAQRASPIPDLTMLSA